MLDFAAANAFLVVSHDVNTMAAAALARVRDGRPMRGLFLAPQFQAPRSVADDLVLIWFASEAQEWDGQVNYLPL